MNNHVLKAHIVITLNTNEKKKILNISIPDNINGISFCCSEKLEEKKYFKFSTHKTTTKNYSIHIVEFKCLMEIKKFEIKK